MKNIKFVRIRNSLLHTEALYGISSDMEDMKNKIFKVKETNEDSVVIYNTKSKRTYKFSNHDIEDHVEGGIKKTLPRHRFDKGDIVIVKPDISKTTAAFTATGVMKDLIGKRIEVSGLRRSDEGGCISVNAGGWQWHPDDLYVVDSVNHNKLVVDGQEGIFTFNPKDLVMNI